ncbi:MAG: hypothetical protein HFE57_13140 [Firmicutes bacterium]|jgi:hypothetical protein|nr:hypothetical protein [Bacillota bacterium]
MDTNILNYYFLFLFLYHRNNVLTQLMAGGGVALIGTILVPLLSGLFG